MILMNQFSSQLTDDLYSRDSFVLLLFFIHFFIIYYSSDLLCNLLKFVDSFIRSLHHDQVDHFVFLCLYQM